MESWEITLLALGSLVVGYYIHITNKSKSNRYLFQSSYFTLLKFYRYAGDEDLFNYGWSLKLYTGKAAKRLLKSIEVVRFIL